MNVACCICAKTQEREQDLREVSPICVAIMERPLDIYQRFEHNDCEQSCGKLCTLQSADVSSMEDPHGPHKHRRHIVMSGPAPGQPELKPFE